MDKRCPKCKDRHSRTEFYNDASTPDGLSCWCKSCKNASVKAGPNRSLNEQKARRTRYRRTKEHELGQSRERVLARLKDNKESGYLYVLHCEGGYYKIGRSIVPVDGRYAGYKDKSRLRTLQAGCPFPLSVYAQFSLEGYRYIEKLLHHRLNAKRTVGEWFHLDEQELRAALEEAGCYNMPMSSATAEQQLFQCKRELSSPGKPSTFHLETEDGEKKMVKGDAGSFQLAHWYAEGNDGSWKRIKGPS